MNERHWALRRITRRRFVGGVGTGAGVALLGIRGAGAHGSHARHQEAGGYDITLIQGVAGDEFYITMQCGAEAMAEQLGVNLDVQGPEEFDFTLQTPLLNAVVQSRPDAILIAPNDRQAMIAPIQAAIDAGIAVFTVDTRIESDIAVANIASDNVEGGRMAARALAEAIGEQGKVFVINVIPGVSTTDQREEGFAEEIANYPAIEYLGQEYSDNDVNRAASIAAARLQADPDLAGIFGTNLFSAQGAAAGVRQAGQQGEVRIVGFDAGPTQVQDLRNEVVDILIAQHPADIGTTAVQMAVEYLDTGEQPAEKEVTTGYTVVTRENIEEPEVAQRLYTSDCSEFELPSATPEAE